MKKKTSFKLFKISSIICIVLTLISFASLSASAESYVNGFMLSDMTTVHNSNVTISNISVYGTPMTRIEKPSGSDGYIVRRNVTDFFNVGSTYRLHTSFRVNTASMQLLIQLSTNPDPFTSGGTTVTLADIHSSNYTPTEITDFTVSFNYPDSFSGQTVYLLVTFGSDSTSRALWDISKLNFYDTNPIPSNWEAPSYSLEEPDIADQIAQFEEATDTFFVVDWFRESNPVGNGAKAFLGLFTSVWTQFDRAPWLKLMVTFAIMTSIVGLIVNSASHIHFKDESYRTYEKNRARKESYDYHYTHKPPED